MSLCLNYITGSSSEPSSSCCQQLASFVKLQCLCAALNGVGCQWGSMSTKIRLWPFVLLAVLRLLPLVVAVIFKMNSYINPFFGANHRGGNGCHLQKANESFHIGFCYLPRNAMINRLTVVWKPTCFYASKHFLSLSGCLVSGECLKAVQQREKFMRKFKRAALWKRLHERNAKHVLSSMIELEGFWGPKEVICHGFNRVQPDLLIVGSWCLSPFQRLCQFLAFVRMWNILICLSLCFLVNGVAQLHGDILKAELFAHGLSRIKPIALLLVDGSDFAVLSSAIPSPNG